MTADLDDIFNDDLPPDHRSGFVAVVGRPNVGKSTLINRILGQKIAIVTNKPQTTRKRQLGIYTEPKGQLMLVDTPGLHRPHHKLGEYMIEVAEFAIQDADLIMWVLDASTPPQEAETYIAETLTRLRTGAPTVLVLNKADLLAPDADLTAHTSLIPHMEAMRVSAMTGEGVSELLNFIMAQMPLGPRYYPADQVSEVNMRFIAAEIIRERIIESTQEEIPYSVAIEVEEYKERSEDLTYINATVYVERESQKGILVGKNGNMIKQIGTQAREALGEATGTRIYLDLHVKVLKDWRSNQPFLRRLGYRMSREDEK
ncbi:MAG: GTPase Era [bacterium]|nr:GTPase Era [bacterium]